MINNTILPRKKNTSTLNKKSIFVCTITYTIISVTQWEQCARKIISKIFTNNYIIIIFHIMLEKHGHSIGETSWLYYVRKIRWGGIPLDMDVFSDN